MHISLLSLAVTGILVASITAQQTPAQLAAQIPTCALACDQAAIAKVNCSETTYSCHCAHSTQLQAIILPCLQSSSNCTTSELQSFGTLVQEICENLNVTASNGTSTSTGSAPSPTVSVSPFLSAQVKLGIDVALMVVVAAGVLLLERL